MHLLQVSVPWSHNIAFNIMQRYRNILTKANYDRIGWQMRRNQFQKCPIHPATHTQQLQKISEAITDNNINITTIMMKVNVFDCGNIIVVEPPGKTSRVGTRGVHRPGGPRAGPENKFI